MEFIRSNFINTTTQLSLTSNATIAENLFNPDIYYQYYTDGFNNDLTTASITVTFSETTTVSRIILSETNLKEFRIFYNGSTANTFSMTNTGSTVTSYFTNNSQTGLYLRCNTTAVSSITIDMKSTQTADQEKVLGELVISDLLLNMTHIPDARGYKPLVVPKQIVHKLADGGTRIHNVRKKYAVNLSFDFLSSDLRDSLKEIYDLDSSFIYCPFGTTTSWDGIFFDAVWEGAFEFYEFSDNAVSAGFSGSVKLKETSL